jgi:hypothetical protein
MTVRRVLRSLGDLGAAGLFVAACGGQELAAPAGEQAVPEPLPIAGRYEVSGSTVDAHTGYRRDISGSVILAEEGARYSATFDLTTTYPDPAAEKPLAADVIGKGEGAIEGRTLRGEAKTQLVVATVPDVDPGFAFIPRSVSTRIVSSTLATIAADGSVSIEIENRPGPGESYSPTRTTLRGMRVAAAAEAADLAAESRRRQ